MTTFFFPHPQTYITYASLARPARQRGEQRWSKAKAKALERWENEGGSFLRVEAEPREHSGQPQREREAVMA